MKNTTRKLLLAASVSAVAVMSMGLSAQAQDAAPTTGGDSATASTDDTVVVITARRKALQTAIQIKKNSDTIVDSVVADEAGNLPDQSITEVLQRVSGVTVTRFSTSNGGTPSFQVEGTGITVRGLPYNSSTLNGRQAFSANGASSLSWGDVTPELMGGVDVYKASRADIMEGGASAIDLRTRLPFDYKKPAFELSAGASYGSMSEKTSPNISGLVSRRFDTKWGEMGLLVDLAHSEYFQGNDDEQMGAYLPLNNPNRPNNFSLVPTGYSWSQGRSERTRDGFYTAFQWKPSDELTLTSTFFYSKSSSSSYGHSGSWGVDPTLSEQLIPADAEQNIPGEATWDDDGAMLAGSLYVGAVGVNTPVFGWGGNNWLQQYINKSDPQYDYIWKFDWSPDWNKSPADTILTADCRTPYGATTTSTPNIDWGKWASPGMFYCQTQGSGGNGRPLNLSGGGSANHGESSTMDFSQSFVWNKENTRVRGALQFVKSEASGLGMSTGITQQSPLLTRASFDVSGDIPILGGFNAAALANTDTAYFNSMSYNGSDNKGSAVAGNIDVDYSLSDDHFFKSISWGARAAVRTERDNFIGTYWAPLAEGWVGTTYPDGSTDGGTAAYLTGPRSENAPFTVPITRNGVTKMVTVNPHGSITPADYELYDFPNFMGISNGSPGAVLVPSLSMLQAGDWAHLAAVSTEAMSDAFNKGLCEQFPDEAVCDSNPGNWTPEQYYTNNIAGTGGGITNTSIRSKAFYVQTKFGSDGFGFIPSFTGNFGVRVVSELLLGDGYFRVNGSQPFYLTIGDASQAAGGIVPPGHMYQAIQSSTPRSKETKYERVLPSFNIKFNVSSKHILRFAASQGVSQPNLGDVKAGGSLEPTMLSMQGPGGTFNYLTTMTSRGAGSDMKPVSFTNYDMSFEWYPKDGVFAYIDVFAKDIKNQDLFSAFYQTQSTPLMDITDENHPVEVTVDLPWFYIQNRTTSALEKATIRGVELGGRTFFDFLPAPFDGFGISGNLTYVDSANPAQLANSTLGTNFIPDGISGVAPSFNPDFTKLPYYGMSKWSYNLELYYSKGPFNARVAYNFHTKQLMSTNANPLSYIGRGGGPHTCTVCVDGAAQGRVWDMVPLYSDDAGYLDFSMDYKLNSHTSFGIQAGNLTNTKSRTLQEPVVGVFEVYDTYVSDRRVSAFLRMRY